MSVIDKTQEKITLAKEIGMRDWAHVRQEMLEEARAIAEIGIKPITHTEIEKMLTKWLWRPGDGNHIFGITFGCFGTLMGILASTSPSMKIIDAHGNIFLSILCGVSILGVLPQIINYGFCSFRKTEVDRKDLKEWTDNIPYGAMLAVKEAKERGFEGFEVYFPIHVRKRLLADPVITGRKRMSHGMLGDTRFMIFAWDDGKVYE